MHLGHLKDRNTGCDITKPPKTRDQIHKCCCSIAQHAGKAISKLMAQGQQVVSNVHAIVVVNGSELWQLLQVFSTRGRRKRNKDPLILC